ncbi:outer membrane protein [Bradyrhizobium sp.]|uniref:outer membrane protein n=1 Tax=Bradyrhizobium sp. TaxID=376 RepID=UPI003C4FD38F
MRKSVTGLFAILASTAPTFAADLAIKAPPAAIPFSWTGCHAGGHVGGVVSQDSSGADSVISSSAPLTNFGSTGFVGGGQVGCDYQFAPSWVVGAEARASWSSLTSSRPATVIFPALGLTVPGHYSVNNDFLASATARLGYSFGEQWLIFARGGAAWTQEKIDNALTVQGISGDARATLTPLGWTVGAGAEWAFASHWSADLEYSYYEFASHGATLTDPAHGTFIDMRALTDRLHSATVGVNYHF